MLDKLVSLLYSKSDTFDKKVKRYSPNVRIIIVTKVLMRCKYQVTERENNFTVSQIRLEEWLP